MAQSAELYFYSNILWKSKKEIEKEVHKLTEEIKTLSQQNELGKEKDEALKFSKRLEILNLYYSYINEYFIKNVITPISTIGDSYWQKCASDFVLACLECNHKMVSLKEITNCILNFNIEKDYGELEKLKQYDNKVVNAFFESNEGFRNSILTIIKESFQKYASLFDENDEYYSFELMSYKETKKQDIMNLILKDIKEIPLSTKFCLEDILSKYELTESEKSEYSLELLENITPYVKFQEVNTQKPYNVVCERFHARGYFQSLSYDFYMYLSLEKFEAKLSPKCIMVMHEGKSNIIDNPEICLKMYKEFLSFVKNSKKNKPKKSEVAKNRLTGVVIDLHWSSAIKNIFRKLPSSTEAKEYILKLLDKYSTAFHN